MEEMPSDLEKARSAQMRLIKSKNTKPELQVRRALFSQGYRYRLHVQDLPGRPDLVFPGKKKAIFIHGCFWHRHEGCKKSRTPKSRLEYWLPKFSSNVERDVKNQEDLAKAGWEFFIIWECELNDIDLLIKRVKSFLDT